MQKKNPKQTLRKLNAPAFKHKWVPQAGLLSALP